MQHRTKWLGAAIAAALALGVPGAALAQGSLIINVPAGVYPSPSAFSDNAYSSGYADRAYGESVAAPDTARAVAHHNRRTVRHSSSVQDR